MPSGRDFEFLGETKQAFFVFAGDSEIKSLISKIYEQAVNLHALEAELPGLSGSARSTNIERQSEIKLWCASTLESIETKFAKYLRLEH